MTLAEIMAMIEQDEFAAEMNLAAGTTAFRRAIREHGLFHRLSELAKKSPSVIATRVESISRTNVDERYENRFDTALSVYLMILSDLAEPDVASKASQSVLRTPRIWWASGIAREVLLRTVAAGVNVVGVDWGTSLYVRLNEWIGATHSSLGRDPNVGELLKAIAAGQPKGKENKVIEFPRIETWTMGQCHVGAKVLPKHKKNSPRLHNVTATRKRA